MKWKQTAIKATAHQTIATVADVHATHFISQKHFWRDSLVAWCCRLPRFLFGHPNLWLPAYSSRSNHKASFSSMSLCSLVAEQAFYYPIVLSHLFLPWESAFLREWLVYFLFQICHSVSFPAYCSPQRTPWPGASNPLMLCAATPGLLPRAASHEHK